MTARRPTGDDGNALVEFTYLAVLLMVPLIYVLLAGFQVQRAAFGVTEAARQAGRAYARADSTATGQARADAASMLAMRDQGITNSSPPMITCLGGGCLEPGSRVLVTVTYKVLLPIFPAVLGRGRAPGIPVTASHVEVVDEFGPGR